MRLKGAALALLLALASGLAARENLRLPWVFSDEPDLNADFGFAPGPGGKTQVELSLGGRFAGFGLPRSAERAPKLEILCDVADPGRLEQTLRSLKASVDLEQVLGEYGLRFERRHFQAGSPLVYKAEVSTLLAPGDYNVRIVLSDSGLGLESRRSLHLIVPSFGSGRWQMGDLKFITAAGKALDAKGHEQRVLDPNPWRQVGPSLSWDLMVAYQDLGPRPAGKLKRKLRIRRLRGDQAQVWTLEEPAPPKKQDQVWLLSLPQAKVSAWGPGVYVLDVELLAGGRTATASKTFEVLP